MISQWASEYVGIPWREGGRDRQAVDCYGAIRLVLSEQAAITLPKFELTGPTDLLRAHDVISDTVKSWRKVERGRERVFDVVQLNRAFKFDGKFYVRPVHLGILVGDGKMLHAEGSGAAGVVLSDFSDYERSVHAVWRHQRLCTGEEAEPGSPFDCRQLLVEAGSTIETIVKNSGIDAATLQFAEVWIGATRIDRTWWPKVKPKPGTSVGIVIVPRGGEWARIGAMVGIIALGTAAAILAPGLLGIAPIWGPVIGNVIIGAGMIAINKFLPPPITKPPGYDNSKASNTYSLSGGSNERRPGGPVPVLLGRHKFIPPSGGQYTEVRGQKIFLHSIFELSCGPITEPEIEIDNTPIDQFDDVSVEFERGWHPNQLRNRGAWNPNTGWPKVAALPGDKWVADRSAGAFAKGDIIVYNGLHLNADPRAWDLNVGKKSDSFPFDVYEERLQVELKWKKEQIRVTGVGADRVGVDLHSPQLGQINSKAGKENYSIRFHVHYAPVEAPESWRVASTDLVMTAGAGGIKETFLGHTFEVSGSASKQYRVRVKRVSNPNNTVDNEVLSDANWIALKTIGNRAPVPNVGVSRVYITVKASGQLNGTLNNVSVTAQSLAWHWIGNNWVWGPTSNPAALLRYIYQMPHWSEPLADSELDLPRFQKWSEFCDRYKFRYNAYIDFTIANIHDFLGDIALAGFAATCRRKNKRSVVIDPVEGGSPVRLFVNGVNCWDCNTKDIPAEDIHGVRINIADEDEDYTVKERVIYNDGYNVMNASRIDDRTFIGLTNKDQAFMLGRMAIAESVLRREVHEIVTNIQGISCEVGSIVGLANDDLAVGTGRGRVSAVLLNDAQTIVGVELSDPVEMIDGKSYGLVYSVNGITNTVAVINEPGITSTLIFASQPAFKRSPEPDCVYSFGEIEREYIPLVVRDVNPNDDGNIRLTLVALPPTIEQLKKDLPEWESYATLPSRLPQPVVTSIKSSAREMIRTAQGDLVTQVIIRLAPVDVQGLQVVTSFKPSGTTEDYTIAQASNIGGGVIAVLGLEDGVTYDFKVHYQHPDYFPSKGTEVLRHRVIGRVDPPEAIKGLRLVKIGPTVARLHWDQPAELDVRFGGGLIVRHSTEISGASWQRSSPLIADEISADRLSITVPLMPGTYMMRVRDGSGNISQDFSSVSTDALTIDEFNVLTGGTIIEEPLYLGAKTNVAVQNGALALMRGDFASVANVAAMPNWRAIGLNVVNGGAYSFAAPYDMGEVRRVRLSRRIIQAADLIGDLISKRFKKISEWESISGTKGAPVDCIVQFRTSMQDPDDNGAIWEPWTRLDVAEIVCRSIEFRALLFTSDPNYGISVASLQAFVEERI